VIDFVPTTAVLSAVSFIELLPAAEFVMLAGVKTAVTPVGNPVTVRLSAPENPLVTEVAIGTATVLPRASVAVVDVVVTLNPLTTSVTITVCVGTPALVPTMVMG
jgi:hypothetical protein